jgi:hypothetical protein
LAVCSPTHLFHWSLGSGPMSLRNPHRTPGPKIAFKIQNCI